MSIIKSIMHKWNGTGYDTLHPETEHAQVKDFGQGVVTHLLASTLASTVTAVTSGSLFGKMVQLLLTATGCKYLMAQNGYICFGSLFGGLILQWGTTNTESSGYSLIATCNFNVAFNTDEFVTIVIPRGNASVPAGQVPANDCFYTEHLSKEAFSIRHTVNTSLAMYFRWISIGY